MLGLLEIKIRRNQQEGYLLYDWHTRVAVVRPATAQALFISRSEPTNGMWIVDEREHTTILRSCEYSILAVSALKAACVSAWKPSHVLLSISITIVNVVSPKQRRKRLTLIQTKRRQSRDRRHRILGSICIHPLQRSPVAVERLV